MLILIFFDVQEMHRFNVGSLDDEPQKTVVDEAPICDNTTWPTGAAEGYDWSRSEISVSTTSQLLLSCSTMVDRELIPYDHRS